MMLNLKEVVKGTKVRQPEMHLYPAQGTEQRHHASKRELETLAALGRTISKHSQHQLHGGPLMMPDGLHLAMSVNYNKVVRNLYN